MKRLPWQLSEKSTKTEKNKQNKAKYKKKKN